MHRYRLPIVAALCAFSLPASAQGRGPARAAVAHLTANLELADAWRGGLEAAMATAFGGEFRRAAGERTYAVMGCDDTEMSARLVDLDGDDTPEVQVEAQGTCVGGMAGAVNWVFIRASSTGAWAPNLGFPGILIPLQSRSVGFLDVMVGGPGFCQPVWRWNGRVYDHLCNAGEGGAQCDRPCPRTVDARISGDELPAFSPAGAPRRP